MGQGPGARQGETAPGHGFYIETKGLFSCRKQLYQREGSGSWAAGESGRGQTCAPKAVAREVGLPSEAPRGWNGPGQMCCLREGVGAGRARVKASARPQHGGPPASACQGDKGARCRGSTQPAPAGQGAAEAGTLWAHDTGPARRLPAHLAAVCSDPMAAGRLELGVWEGQGRWSREGGLLGCHPS